MDAPEENGQQPVHYANWSSFFYFVAYIVVVAYTLLNLYIGVVFYQFRSVRRLGSEAELALCMRHY
jgi:hypothetical protein